MAPESYYRIVLLMLAQESFALGFSLANFFTNGGKDVLINSAAQYGGYIATTTVGNAIVFGIGGLFLASSPAFASYSGILADNNGTGGGGSCPEAGPTPSGTPTPRPETSESLARVPTADRGAFEASTLGICSIAMESGAY